MAEVIINPVTRIEGHLSIEINVINGKVEDAHVKGDMFRGFEKILQGRNPLDAQQITQRICGVCPVSHGIASALCLDDAFGINTNKNGRLLRNLIFAANYLQSHILHFYHLSAVDYIDIRTILSYSGKDEGMNRLKNWANAEVKNKMGKKDQITAISPFLPRYEGKDFYIRDRELNMKAIADYVKALDIRMKAHRMCSVFAGRVPHTMAIVPGGITKKPDRTSIREYKSLLSEIEKFVNDIYLKDVVAVASSFPAYFKLGEYKNHLSYGVFELDEESKLFEAGIYLNGKMHNVDPEKIREDVLYSRYSSGSGLHPYEGKTDPDPHKRKSYSWIKAPRYNNMPYEVGPLSRMITGYSSGNELVKKNIDGLLKSINGEVSMLFSVMGRHAARAVECSMLCEKAHEWLDELDPGSPPRNSYTIPDKGKGMGLTEAPRGALGHWIVINDKKIENYQCVVPTTWFCSPRDDRGVRGPVEDALVGTPISDEKNPIEAVRVVKSFDPCIACAVHVIEGDRDIGKFRIY